MDDGKIKYKCLPDLVKTALVLPHGNVDVERSLSVTTSVVTEDRPAIGERTICAIRTVKDTVKFHDPISHQPHKVPLTREIPRSAKMAYSTYRQRLDHEKEEKERQLKKTGKSQSCKEKTRQRKRGWSHKTASVLDKEKELLKKESELQGKVLISEGLLKEGSAKLNKAFETGDLQGAGVAPMMIATASWKIESLRSE